MQNKPRRTDYTDVEFRDMIRSVSDAHRRIYFTDVDFVGYVYSDQEIIYKIILEAKRDYQIENGIYTLVNSDKSVIQIARSLGVPFIFVFYAEGRLSDRDSVKVIHIRDVVETIKVQEYLQKGDAKQSTVAQLKEFLRELSRGGDFQTAWQIL